MTKTKITFSSTQRAESTHRISDGVESSYFAWTGDMTGEKITAEYSCGYDINDGDEAVEIIVYDLENSVVFKAKF
jgi:hypothetical protein